MDDFTSLPNVLRLGEPDAELAQILQPDREPASYPDIDIGRKNMFDKDKQAAIRMQTDSLVHSTKTIVMRDGYESEMRIFSPKNISAQDKAPLVVLYFGGGFMFGNNYQCANYATAISTLCSAVVVLPSYRLAPEHPFPTGPNDAWDSFVWIATNAAEEFHADPAIGFIVGGRSAGGTMAAVIAQRTLTENFTGPRITGTWLCMPMLLTERCVPDDERDQWVSRDQNQDAPFFNTAMIDVLLGNWKPDELSPLFSPFNAGPTRHRGLPTTYLQVCGMDPLRDDALLYERALRREGVHTILDVYPGVPHGVTTPFPQLKASRKFQIDVIVRVGQMLGHSLDRMTVEKVFRWL